MDIPSPPFSSCRDCILNRQSLQKKIVVQERRYGAMQPQQERCLELIPGRMEVVRKVVTGPRKWEIRS